MNSHRPEQMNYGDMTTKVDWLSFSYQTETTDAPDYDWITDCIALIEKKSPVAHAIIDRINSATGAGRRPYSMSYGNEYGRTFFSPTMEWSLVEINGTGCSIVQAHSLVSDMCREVHDRCTRIDIATDIYVGDERAVETFIAHGFSKRFKSTSWNKSSTGETFYIGSRKSERMVRVYQYAKPHPRHSMMRVEFEFKGERAKQVCKALIDNEASEIMSEVSKAHDFKSPLWNPIENDNQTLEPLVGKQKQNGTVAWFHKQVSPAFVKLVRNGTITDPEAFLRDVFINALEQE